MHGPAFGTPLSSPVFFREVVFPFFNERQRAPETHSNASSPPDRIYSNELTKKPVAVYCSERLTVTRHQLKGTKDALRSLVIFKMRKYARMHPNASLSRKAVEIVIAKFCSLICQRAVLLSSVQ
ncbi:hypothetical protein Q1695_001032 [Nippostrongylus brasiliensis]|nr:hypothetical protein Q1695_001032 [Nippostrongylus brasiliensis]